jgi:hypothetical protein
MFLVTQIDADVIRDVYHRDGELAAVVELRRRFLGTPTTLWRGTMCARSWAGDLPALPYHHDGLSFGTLSPIRRRKFQVSASGSTSSPLSAPLRIVLDDPLGDDCGRLRCRLRRPFPAWGAGSDDLGH